MVHIYYSVVIPTAINRREPRPSFSPHSPRIPHILAPKEPRYCSLCPRSIYFGVMSPLPSTLTPLLCSSFRSPQVLISSSCYYQCHGLTGLSSKEILKFLTLLETGQSNQCWLIWFLVGEYHLGLELLLAVYSLENIKIPFFFFLLRASIPFMRALFLWLNFLQLSPTSPNTITLGLGLQHRNFERIQTFSPPTPVFWSMENSRVSDTPDISFKSYQWYWLESQVKDGFRPQVSFYSFFLMHIDALIFL